MSQYDLAVGSAENQDRQRKHFTLAEAKQALPLVKRVETRRISRPPRHYDSGFMPN